MFAGTRTANNSGVVPVVEGACHYGEIMTIPGNLDFMPTYMRRRPRWYDGAARLLDIGGVFDFQAPTLSDADLIREDQAMVQGDMRHAVEQLRAAAELTSGG